MTSPENRHPRVPAVGTSFPRAFRSLLRDLPIMLAGLALVLCAAVADALLDRARHAQADISLRPARCRNMRCFRVLRIAHRVRLQPGFHPGLRLRGGVQRQGGTIHDSAAGHAAVHSRAEFPARRDAVDGGAFSHAATGHRAGIDPADFYGAGVEHGVQLLLLAEKHSERDARSGARSTAGAGGSG